MYKTVAGQINHAKQHTSHPLHSRYNKVRTGQARHKIYMHTSKVSSVSTRHLLDRTKTEQLPKTIEAYQTAPQNRIYIAILHSGNNSKNSNNINKNVAVNAALPLEAASNA